ncbi:MAG: class I SAM-dependent methyltransferase [Nitrospiraceae bacterium]
MFSVEYLHVIRRYEIQRIVRHFPPGARVLEIGGGTGYQASLSAEQGFDVVSIDVATSNYREDRVFPVTVYDGRVFPFQAGTFDIVFSSNALEHIVELPQIHRESRRVLKPGGSCVHVMPTAVWRFWTSVTHYVELLQRWAALSPRLLPQRFSRSGLMESLEVFKQMGRLAKDYALPPRHGETGNVLTELWTFSRRHWVKHFRLARFTLDCVEPMGLFYTGNMVLGRRWALPSRERVAAFLGCACILYKVRPTA